MKILITGGCGFIGLNLVDALLQQRPQVAIRILDNLSVGTREELSAIIGDSSRVELMVGDVRDAETCDNACHGVEAVVHLAALSGVAPSLTHPREALEMNVDATLNLLESSRQAHVDKFIFASSGAVIGPVDGLIHEECVAKPLSPYGASKLSSEVFCHAYYHSYGLKTICLRFSNVYGPHSDHKESVVAQFLKNALAHQALTIFGDGTQARDFIYIDDLTRAIGCALDADLGGEVFQIATNRATHVDEIARHIQTIVKRELGFLLPVMYGQERKGDAPRIVADTSKAQRLLGFVSEISVKQGLELTFKYFNT